MSKLIKYILHIPTWRKLPKPPGGYASEYDPQQVSADVRRLMELSQVRDPQSAELLSSRRARSVHELAATMDRSSYARRIRSRIHWLICRVTDTLPYDPAAEPAREWRRRNRSRRQ